MSLDRIDFISFGNREASNFEVNKESSMTAHRQKLNCKKISENFSKITQIYVQVQFDGISDRFPSFYKVSWRWRWNDDNLKDLQFKL